MMADKMEKPLKMCPAGCRRMLLIRRELNSINLQTSYL
jgi:hypothetical protein